MASQTGCEIMNSEVAGSIVTVFPRQSKKKERDFLTFKNLYNSTTWKTTMRAMYRIIASHSNPEKVALDTGYCEIKGGEHRVPPAGLPIEQVLGEYSLSFLRRDVALFVSIRAGIASEIGGACLRSNS